MGFSSHFLGNDNERERNFPENEEDGCEAELGISEMEKAYQRRVVKLERWLLEAVDRESLQRVGRKLAEMAEQGNVAAAQVLFDFLMPREE